MNSFGAPFLAGSFPSDLRMASAAAFHTSPPSLCEKLHVLGGSERRLWDGVMRMYILLISIIYVYIYIYIYLDLL